MTLLKGHQPLISIHDLPAGVTLTDSIATGGFAKATGQLPHEMCREIVIAAVPELSRKYLLHAGMRRGLRRDPDHVYMYGDTPRDCGVVIFQWVSPNTERNEP